MNEITNLERFQKSQPLSREVITLNGVRETLVAGERKFVKTPEGTKLIFDFTWINPPSEIGESALTVICDFLATHSEKYAETISRALRTWINDNVSPENDVLELTHLETLLSKHSNVPRGYIDFIIPALRYWAGQNLPGLSSDLIEWLNDGYKLEESGNGAYFVLLTNDPERGALTMQEMLNLHGVLNQAYSEGKVDLSGFTLCWMFIATGVRPIQVARMRKGDVRIDKVSPEGNEVTLMIPLAKGEGVADQGKWKRRAPSVLAECLVKYLELSEMKSRSDDERLFDGAPLEISQRLSKIFAELDTWSDRLEGSIPINPYRFRYTLGTRAIAQGASDHEVARLLTHRKTSCIKYYRASMPQLQNPLKASLGREMEFFAKSFQGRLINDLTEATRSNDKDALILDFLRLAGKPVGACGTRAECYQHAPIACLPCNFFEPFYGAPWEELQKKILEENESEPEIRIKEIYLNALSALHEIIRRRDGHYAQGGQA